MSDMKTVVVTGAAKGIGKAIVEKFATEGWRVIATVHTLPRKPNFLFPDHPEVIVKRLDVTKTAEIRRFLRWLKQKKITPDVLVNNAGIGLYGPFEGSSSKEIEAVYRTNVLGLFEMCRAVIPVMRQHGGGTIVNISSIGGRATIPYYATYGSTKAAVESFTEGVAREVAPFGIRMKLVEPGGVRTDFYTSAISRTDFPKEYRKRARKARAVTTIFQQAQSPKAIGNVVYRAATSRSHKLRYASSWSVKLFLFGRRILPDRVYAGLLKMMFG